MVWTRDVVITLAVIFALTLTASVVTAEISTNTQTEYNGENASSNQAITVTHTFSPEGSKISDVIVNFQSTQGSFLEGGSFSYTIEPGDADVNVTSVGKGEFRIQELDPSEEITFTFKVYPKTIKKQSLNVAEAKVNYVQNGQQLSTSETISADLSTSPWFKYKEVQQQLQNEKQDETISFGMFAGAIGIGLVGLVLGGFFYTRINSNVSEEHQRFANDLESLKNDTSSAKARKQIQELIDKYSEGTTMPGPTESDSDDDEGGPEPPTV
ncbi:MAG: hypothetical protein ABEI86_04420 [Halobacteriaceae archaeon]